MKLKWKVGEKPTGRYRSFGHRSWPSAEYALTEDHAGGMSAVSGESYRPAIAETAELYVWVAIRNGDKAGFDNRRMKKRVVGVKAAKAQLQEFIDGNSDKCWPVGLKDIRQK